MRRKALIQGNNILNLTRNHKTLKEKLGDKFLIQENSLLNSNKNHVFNTYKISTYSSYILNHS